MQTTCMCLSHGYSWKCFVTKSMQWFICILTAGTDIWCVSDVSPICYNSRCFRSACLPSHRLSPLPPMCFCGRDLHSHLSCDNAMSVHGIRASIFRAVWFKLLSRDQSIYIERERVREGSILNMWSRACCAGALLGPCLDVVWTLFGFCLDVVWALFGCCLDFFWMLFGFCLGVYWY